MKTLKYILTGLVIIILSACAPHFYYFKLIDFKEEGANTYHAMIQLRFPFFMK